MAMPVDNKRPLSNGKSIPPNAPIRSKAGPYLAPKLANQVKTVSNSEIGRDSRSINTQSNVKVAQTGSITTPVKSFLATNVTPRSSSRKSRAGSTNSTPRGTPDSTSNGSRPGSMSASQNDAQIFAEEARTRMTMAEELTGIATVPSISKTYQGLSADNSISAMQGSSKFFHANDAISIPKKGPGSSANSVSTFFYADGRREERQSRPDSQANSVASSQVSLQHRLYSPSGQSDTSPSLNRTQTSLASATSPKLPYPVRPPNYFAPRTRSTSPLKEFDTPGQQNYGRSRRASGASAISTRSTTKSSISPQSPRTKTHPEESRGHMKAQSINSLDDVTRTNKVSIPRDLSLSAVQPPQSNREVAVSPSFFTINTAQLGSPSTPISPFASPDRMTASDNDGKINHFSSLAANARTERKVLDLEISNSSLLAINRTLEREMRKQKSELRRYRRLTRGGRLSFVPKDRAVSGASTISTLSIDSELNIDSDAEGSLTDILSEDEDEELEDSDDSSEALSPEAQAEKDLRQRERDEKRLKLDLSKHQQLLIDSQKLNESLKRCLVWTEELISEGRKAIDYRIRAGEVKLGGRVLSEDDNPDMQDARPRHGLLSPTTTQNPRHVLWSSEKPEAMALSDSPENIHSLMIAEEGKEFREYLDGLQG